MNSTADNSTADKKFFEVDEANRMLPLVRKIVADIVQLFADVHERRERIVRVRQLPTLAERNDENAYSEELQQIEKDLDKDIGQLQGYIDELQELGVLLKDPVAGLVDFPTLIDGREALLCWKMGEEDIAFWHELDSGFQGRQSLFEQSVPGENSADEEPN